MQNESSASASDSVNITSLLREMAACPVIAVDATRAIIAADPEAIGLLGSETELLHKPAGALPAPLRSVVEEVFAQGRPVSSRLVSLPVPGRGDQEIDIRAVAARDPSGAIRFVILLLADLSEIRRLELRMQQLERLASVGSFSANTSHEIRNALVAIKTFLDLLIGRNQDVELAELAVREVKRIDAIASQVLTFSGPPKHSFAPLHLHQVLDESLQLVEYQTEKRQIRLRRAFAASLDQVKGNKGQLEQAFINMLFNALEAMSPGGELRVSTQNETDKIVVSIHDTGSGIAPDHMSRLFQPFFTTKPHGTGLGLPIASRIIHDHSGDIAVESQPGKGTTFHLCFPLDASGRET